MVYAAELAVEVPTLKELEATDLTPFTAVYLGHPYCRLYRDNLLSQPDHLEAAVAYLRDRGLKTFVSTDAAPTTGDLPLVRELLEQSLRLGVDGVEVQNLGVLRMVHHHYPKLRVIAGGFINLYTLEGARTLAQFGASIIRPAYELDLEEIDVIRNETGLEVELLVHGKIPLGITDRCLLLDYQEQSGLSCPDICLEDFWLKRDSWQIRHIGTVILSGKDLCLLEHLPNLLGRGYRRFRIGTLVNSPEHRSEIGRIYRKALECAADPLKFSRKSLMKHLEKLSSEGLCNGYYFGKSGHSYVNYRGEEVGGSRSDILAGGG